MASRGKPLDFEVTSEPWNKYEVNDGTILKFKYVMKTIFRTMKDNKANYTGEGQPLSVVIPTDNLRGEPDKNTYNTEQLKASIEKDEMSYRTVAEEWNEYRVDDGAVLRIKATVMKVSRTTKYDKNGNPIYLVDNNIMIQVRPPKIPKE